MSIHVVSPGESIDSIALLYSVQPSVISYANQIPAPYRLAVGEALYIPESILKDRMQSIKEDIPMSIREYRPESVRVGGYAYPFISRYVLEQTLPFLDYLYIFSYGFTPEGELVPPRLDDTWMINLAKAYGTAPVMTLTPSDKNSVFNNNLISAVVNDLNARRTLKNQIVEAVVEMGFEGVDIDFEYIKAEDRDAFVDFVVYIREAVNALGYPVSVALAPKTYAGQPGLLYEGKDYRGLGAAADYVLLMTYEWGYKYSAPMAVAPINKIRPVLDYAVTEIPPDKIHLGIPNYGYNWPLPYIQGKTAATTIGNVEAVQIAIQNNAVIQFDETAQSPFFTYPSHEVWFEDVRSMAAKFELVKEYGLRGMSYWQIMQLFRANWLLLNDTFS